MTVYDAVKRLASQRGLSIYRIERDLQLSNGSIRRWNSSMPAADTLTRVAKYLGTTVEDILNKSRGE